MSCGCENRRMGQEYERIRRLAKAWAQAEKAIVATYKNSDGTYGFTQQPEAVGKPIVEYITPY